MFFPSSRFQEQRCIFVSVASEQQQQQRWSLLPPHRPGSSPVYPCCPQHPRTCGSGRLLSQSNPSLNGKKSRLPEVLGDTEDCCLQSGHQHAGPHQQGAEKQNQLGGSEGLLVGQLGPTETSRKSTTEASDLGLDPFCPRAMSGFVSIKTGAAGNRLHWFLQTRMWFHHCSKLKGPKGGLADW